ncbi:response regulator [Sphingobium phenoxybenzoativorans]|uniref:Response regulator n=1 Tax=Sphingobium phenoxybenzoativorans TaxID=1592790 RepID=A0A975KBI1_9SPHN|nr:response regulator [Sphingobium phenoxybenzoativorans]QUT07997.1 response regulator [Sphingobium phenoxybenzoativorans]
MFFGKDRRVVHQILVVEDEPLVAFDNEHFLTHAGYVVVDTVDSLGHAQSVLASQVIDLVIADVNLSGNRDGIAVATEAHRRGIAVLFVTGSCPADARHLAYGCLAKPYSQRDLLSAIEVVDAIMRGAKVPRLPRGLSLFERRMDGNAA